MNSAVPDMYRSAVEELRENRAMSRLAGFQDRAWLTSPLDDPCLRPDEGATGTFGTYFPKIRAYYQDSLSKLHAERPELRRPYESSIMPAAAFNLGPATVCRPHRDSANLLFGICIITALGFFDPVHGGHLVLHELRLVIQFPPGSTVLIPSAFVTHSNTRIRGGETRYSFTQYAAGSLFSYVENGMRSQQAVMKGPELCAEDLLKRSEADAQRWRNGLSLFPHISDYRDSR